MFEALVAITLMSMEPPQGPAGIEWARSIKTFSSELETDEKQELIQESKLKLVPSETFRIKKSAELDLTVSDVDSPLTDVPNFLDAEHLAADGNFVVVAEASEYAQWTWFKKHQNWLSIDKKVLKTREDSLFQDWSPL